ncbi:hypothetical protein G7085_18785 [Tessaracoccus sp. HDW20]|uniref:hypothetical protein n=1 Tax=Tessaracoccus coleopterorum TaxID=2714950 RepID=UPI0018D2CA88|nr:hypothetical protein [Tessaracoccus coleopterorum]NHB85900.1 hypothetical protein [Tessaracoccus coleopterorum]
MAAAVSFQVVDAGSRRVVAVSPAGRPDLHLPQARPARGVRPGCVSRAAACSVERRAKGSALMCLKVAAVALLTVVGGVVSVSQFVADAAAGQSTGYVAGDPAWAHVTQP